MGIPFEVEDFFKGEEAIVLLVGQEGFENYGNYAKSIEDVNFVHCFAQECLSNYNVSSGTVVVLKKFDDKRNDLAPGYSFDSFNTLQCFPLNKNFNIFLVKVFQVYSYIMIKHQAMLKLYYQF